MIFNLREQPDNLCNVKVVQKMKYLGIEIDNRLVVWPIYLNFMLCFLLIPLYASTRTHSKGTCAKPLINFVQQNKSSLLSPL